ncbi:MAG: NAD(+)/NADH kinase [Thermodesulfobacteriota bacterium]
MQPIGIIANPASGKDIRRLVAYGSVFDNNEKVNIVRRVLLGLEALGVREVWFMPDFFGIGPRAVEDLKVSFKTRFLPVPVEGTQEDSTLAAGMLRDMNAACLVTLGGDGTNRAVAKACGEMPLLPISTGTNNVFPAMIESTLAGLAAGVLCAHPEYRSDCLRRTPRLEIRSDGRLLDLALVDVVVTKAGFVGSRALWDVEAIREMFLARAEPGHIGFSSVGGHLDGLEHRPGQGLHLKLGQGGRRVLAPIAPGLIRWVPIQTHRVFLPGEEIPLSRTPALVALDGERELTIKAGESCTVSLNLEGPWVVDLGLTLGRAAAEGLFTAPLST